MAQVPALPGHALAVLLIQVALILTVSRLLAELMKRLGQPSVIGELLTGVVLGPSLLGWIWPGYFSTIFPADPTQVHLLEVVAWFGMVLLLLLTGLETDVRLLRNLGRAALSASAFGMTVNFAGGFTLGLLMPEHLLANPERRLLFAAFLATAMSISAMPVIAKILMDLELTKRNIALIILSAGVVDDTTGWLLLSLIAGIAKAQDWVFLRFLKTLGLTVGFLAASRYLVYPFARWLFRTLDHKARSPGAELTAIIVLTFLMASTTEAIGIHAVFGAFVTGCVLRQVPQIRHATLHRLEAVTLAVFAPVFFGLAGLKVELRSLDSPRLVLVVLGVATAGKLIGCTFGGLVGRMRFWEALSIGVAMNARGAMELVVALIGLNLGILSPSLYAAIVVMAIGTSFLAPILLRLTLTKVKMTPEEEARLQSAAQRGTFDAERLKALIPTAGGPNALVAGRVAAAVVRGEPPSLTLLYVQSKAVSIVQRLKGLFVPDPAGRNLQEHLELIKGYAEEKQARVEVRKQTEEDVVTSVCREAAHGYDVILLGAGLRNPLRSAVTQALLDRAPCHVAIVRGGGAPRDARNVLIATDGSYFSRAAVELGILYAERVGASVTLLYSMELEHDGDDREVEEDTGANTLEENFRRMMATTLLTTLSPLVSRTTAKVSVTVRDAAQPTLPVLAEVRTGMYQLLVVGAESSAVKHRLSVGYDVDKLVAEAPCSVVIVVPKIGGAQA